MLLAAKGATARGLLSATALSALALCLMVETVAAQQIDSTLTVYIDGVETREGQVLVALYDVEADWLRDGHEKYVRKAPAAGGRQGIDFAHLAPGRYAVAAYHDANDDGELSTNAFGLPTEAYGFGNDARGVFGPPRWSACVIEFEGRGHTSVRLK